MQTKDKSARTLDLRRFPKYVQACLTNSWTILSVSTTGKVGRFPFRCSSRRCPRCRPHWGQRAYQRIYEALSRVDVSNVVFAVFTLDQRGRYGGHKFRDAEHAMHAFPWQGFLRRLKYWAAKKGHRVGYVATVEVHKSGWPHLNVLFYCEPLADVCRAYDAEREKFGREIEDMPAHHLLGRMALAAGFGPMCTFEMVRTIELAAGYISKVAKGTQGFREVGVDVAAKEATKASQDPVDAPSHFRTLRSSRRFLPAHKPKKAKDLKSAGTWLVNEAGCTNDRQEPDPNHLNLMGQLVDGDAYPKAKGPIVDLTTGQIFETWEDAARGVWEGSVSELANVWRIRSLSEVERATKHHAWLAKRKLEASKFPRPRTCVAPSQPPEHPAFPAA